MLNKLDGIYVARRLVHDSRTSEYFFKLYIISVFMFDKNNLNAS